jgi:hypothetical protein
MGIIDNVKDIAELIKTYNNVELNQKIVDLRDEIFELKENNLKFKEKIKSLEEEKKINEKMIFEPPFYWLKDGEKKDGPYCQKCYDDNKKLIRLQDLKNGYWTCLVCKSSVADPSYKLPNRVNKGGSWMSS